MRRWLWIILIPRKDLNMVHQALRITLQHPTMPNNPNLKEIEELAEALWTESSRRPNKGE